MTWTDEAACAGHSVPECWEVHEPLPAAEMDLTARKIEKAHRAVQRRAAISICQDCPVATECLAAADAYDIGAIRGGVLITAEMVGRTTRRIPSWPVPLEPHGSAAAAMRHWRAGEPLCLICQDGDSRRRVDQQQGAA